MRKPDYRRSIMNVSRSILKHYGAYEGDDTIPVLDQALKQGFNHVIFMLLDGLGTNVLKIHLPKTAFLRQHYRQTITSVFPSTTVAATNAVLAAEPPVTTGYLGWVQYFKEEDKQIVVFLNEDYYTGEKATLPFRQTYHAYPSLAARIRKQQHDVVANEIFHGSIEGGSKTFDEHLARLDARMKAHEKTMTYVYWTDPDMTEHTHGIHHEQTGNVIRELDRKTALFAENMPDDALLIVIADHGLIDVIAEPLYENQALLDCLIRPPSIEARATTFFVKPDCHEPFQRLFNKRYKRHFKLLTKGELYQLGLLGDGKMHPRLDEYLGEYIAIATKNRMFMLQPGKPFLAHHAGLTKGELQVPLIIYHR